MCRQELAALQQQLKNANVAVKGAEKGQQIAKRDLDNSLKKCTEMEVKAKNAGQDKSQVCSTVAVAL